MGSLFRSRTKTVVAAVTILAAAVFFFAPLTAQARISLTQILAMVTDLAARVEALEQAGPGDDLERKVRELRHSAHASGIVAVSESVQDCVKVSERGEWAMYCEEKSVLTLSVVAGQELTLEGVEEGEPVSIVLKRVAWPDPQFASDKAFSIEVLVEKGADSLTFSLSPNEPLHDSRSVGETLLDLKASLLTDSLMSIVSNINNVAVVETESSGSLTAAYDGATGVLDVTVLNNGDLLAANYLVTVSGTPPQVPPVPAQRANLDPGTNGTLSFQFHPVSPLAAGDQCTGQSLISDGKGLRRK